MNAIKTWTIPVITALAMAAVYVAFVARVYGS